MTQDTDGAIKTLRDGLQPERKKSFPQADTLVRTLIRTILEFLIHLYHLQLTFELAWTLLSHRRYEETAEQFLDITKLNSWFSTFSSSYTF